MPYRTGDVFSGMIYEGCLLYIEKCTTIGVIGYRTSPDGVKTNRYGNVTVERIVKYNPVTGTVSSPCLDPICNHSLESGCPMLLSRGVNDGHAEQYIFKGVFGDWLVYVKYNMDAEYGSVMTEIMYNMKTGEVRSLFGDDYGDEVVSKWRNGWYSEGKYYKINSIMDYSDTGYIPGTNQSLADFEPVTKQYLYEYDFETNTSRLLFEIFDGCQGFMATRERFYFAMDDGKQYSVKKDGTDKRAENPTASSNFVGTYSILYKSDGFATSNLLTNELKETVFDYSLVGTLCVTEKGVLSSYQTKYEERKAFSSSQYRKDHPNASSEEISKIVGKIWASGAAQIWQCGYWGEDNHVIFELPAAYMEIISAYGDYVFATVSRYNPETGEHLEGYDSQPCCINIATGEVTPIPKLDIVVPYWYVN